MLNFDNTVGAVGFVPVLFSSVLPLGPIRVDENGDPVRDPLTGLCIRYRLDLRQFLGIRNDLCLIRLHDTAEFRIL